MSVESGGTMCNCSRVTSEQAEFAVGWGIVRPYPEEQLLTRPAFTSCASCSAVPLPWNGRSKR